MGPDPSVFGQRIFLTAMFGMALGELRAAFSTQIGIIAERYELELSGPVAALLPTSEADDSEDENA